MPSHAPYFAPPAQTPQYQDTSYWNFVHSAAYNTTPPVAPAPDLSTAAQPATPFTPRSNNPFFNLVTPQQPSAQAPRVPNSNPFRNGPPPVPPRPPPPVPPAPFPPPPVQPPPQVHTIYYVPQPKPDSGKYTVPTLTSIPELKSSDDFVAWWNGTENQLYASNVISHVADYDPEVVVGSRCYPSYIPQLTQFSTIEEFNAREEWLAKDGLAYGILTGRLAPGVMATVPSLREGTAARDVYHRLRRAYGGGLYTSTEFTFEEAKEMVYSFKTHNEFLNNWRKTLRAVESSKSFTVHYSQVASAIARSIDGVVSDEAKRIRTDLNKRGTVIIDSSYIEKIFDELTAQARDLNESDASQTRDS
ncbi:hypothetical protein BDZ89DRAFT_1131589 [Hymenopellis radicata]|nr:hypothetical protein BDZ89DRAFT_1131589 [Hymenopellis radicata]